MSDLIVKIALSFVVLYIGNILISSDIPSTRILAISVIAQLFFIYALPYVMEVGYMVPVPRVDLIIKSIVWVELVNFVVPKTKPKEYFILGFMAFGVNYLVGLLEIATLIPWF